MKVAATTAPTTTRLFQPKLVDRCSQSEIVKFLEHRLFRLRSSTGKRSRAHNYTIVVVPFAKSLIFFSLFYNDLDLNIK